MKKLLFVENGQFGYDYTTYNIINEIGNSYDVLYLGIHEGKKYISSPKKNIKVKHLNIYNSGFLGKIEFQKKILILLKEEINDYAAIHFYYYMFCSPLVLKLDKNKVIVDFRTGYISNNRLVSLFKNKLLQIESRVFTHRTTLSQNLKKFLKLPSTTKIVGLGANLPKEHFKTDKQKLHGLNFLYVGTLHQRKIDIFLRGAINFFANNHKDHGCVTIIGSGNEKEISEIKTLVGISPPNLEIKYLGAKLPTELETYYLSHNIGVSFVPIERKYNYQPVTKTIEYLTNGLVVLGTNTLGNREIVCDWNGVLIDDTIEGVVSGITSIKTRMTCYDRSFIKFKSKNYSWKRIIHEQLIPIIKEIENKKLK